MGLWVTEKTCDVYVMSALCSWWRWSVSANWWTITTHSRISTGSTICCRRMTGARPRTKETNSNAASNSSLHKSAEFRYWLIVFGFTWWLRPREGCEVLRSASVCLSVRSHILKTTGPNFTTFFVHVNCDRDSLLIWRDWRQCVVCFRFCGCLRLPADLPPFTAANAFVRRRRCGALSPVHTSNNVQTTLSNDTSLTILSTMSNVASTLLPFLATMLPVSATLSNEISSFRQSPNKLNMFSLFRLCRKDEILRYSFDIVAVCGNKVECCFDKVERSFDNVACCFDVVAGVDGALRIVRGHHNLNCAQRAKSVSTSALFLQLSFTRLRHDLSQHSLLSLLCVYMRKLNRSLKLI